MFKIVWDPEYNGVRLTMSAKGDALNVSPRPVFCEELNLLGLDRMGWNYPPRYKNLYYGHVTVVIITRESLSLK